MKKTFLLAISTLILLSCNQKASNTAEKTDSNEQNQTESVDKPSVSLSVEPKTLKLTELPDTIQVKMSNNSSDTITTGLQYSIEKSEGNQWNEVSPKDIVFQDLGCTLNPTDTEIFEKNLYKDKIKYEVGEYRIVKYYLKSDFQKTKERFDVFAEFEIE